MLLKICLRVVKHRVRRGGRSSNGFDKCEYLGSVVRGNGGGENDLCSNLRRKLEGTLTVKVKKVFWSSGYRWGNEGHRLRWHVEKRKNY